ncbi:hypothetical protein [Vibrio mexicanus]|uniref:hypothetical protein n=1 Tax=Vibrio mexicanus TaxID=1004326 RepID=UPI00063CBD98|nr:hypothetical protein [Vibrio mexicanus]
MELHACKIRLNDDQILTCRTVEQSLTLMEEMKEGAISHIEIDATDGHRIHTYTLMDYEESIESLMNL